MRIEKKKRDVDGTHTRPNNFVLKKSVRVCVCLSSSCWIAMVVVLPHEKRVDKRSSLLRAAEAGGAPTPAEYALLRAGGDITADGEAEEAVGTNPAAGCENSALLCAGCGETNDPEPKRSA